jgi:hypothetical protein
MWRGVVDIFRTLAATKAFFEDGALRHQNEQLAPRNGQPRAHPKLPNEGSPEDRPTQEPHPGR